MQPLLEENKSQTEMQFENDEDIEALGAAAPPLPTAEAPKPLSAGIASTAGKTDSLARKKGAGAGLPARPARWARAPHFPAIPWTVENARWKLNRDVCRVQSVAFG